jgi:hypothetical protein
MPDQSVIIHLKLSDDGFGEGCERWALYKFEDILIDVAEKGGLGWFDGNEWGGGFYKAYLYGPDADRLFNEIHRALAAEKLPQGSFAIKTYGTDRKPDCRVELGGHVPT